MCLTRDPVGPRSIARPLTTLGLGPNENFICCHGKFHEVYFIFLTANFSEISLKFGFPFSLPPTISGKFLRKFLLSVSHPSASPCEGDPPTMHQKSGQAGFGSCGETQACAGTPWVWSRCSSPCPHSRLH